MRLIKKLATSVSDLLDEGLSRIGKVIKDEALHSLEKNLIMSNEEIEKENEKIKKRKVKRSNRKQLINASNKE
jgi:hypothetical protein